MPQRSAQPHAGEQGPAAAEPFKQIACANIGRLCLELSPPALKVWMFHLSLTNKDDSSYAKLEKIAAGTGLHSFTVKIARSWLRENGWLELVRYRKFGSASLPELRCVVPGPRVQKTPSLGSGMVQKAPGVGSRRLKKTPWAMVQKTPAEVDSNLEVHENSEVDRTPQQFTFGAMQTPILPIGLRRPTAQRAGSAAGIWNEIRASLKRRVNPHSFETWFSPLEAESFSGDRLRLRVPSHLWMKRMQDTYADLWREALAET
jgi:hypothetical protein